MPYDARDPQVAKPTLQHNLVPANGYQLAWLFS